MSDVSFLESLFPQIEREKLLQVLDLYNGNITEAVDHIISNDEETDDQNDDDIDTLTKLFPSASTVEIQTAWIESNGKIQLAAQFLCENALGETNEIPVLHDAFQEKNENDNIYILIEMFPDHSVEFLTSVLHDHGLHKGISMLLNMNNVCKGDCIDSGYPCLIHSSSQSFKLDDSIKFKFEKRRQELQFLLPPISRTQEQPFNTVLDESEISKGSVYLRKMAQEARKQRNDSYQQASSTWKSNNLTGRGSASYYGLQGRNYHNEFCKWNALAVEALLRENSVEGVLDLHGFTVQESIQVLQRKILEWTNSHSKKFKIVVGRGNRSVSGSRLGPAVKKWLTDNNIRHQSEPGSFSIVLN